MKHGEEIHHTDIVAPFACWRLDIPKTLHIFAGQGAILFAVAIGQCKGSHGMKLQYKIPLRCDDEFISRLNLKKDGLKRQRRAALFPRHRGTRLSHQRPTRQQSRIRRSL